MKKAFLFSIILVLCLPFVSAQENDMDYYLTVVRKRSA